MAKELDILEPNGKSFWRRRELATVLNATDWLSKKELRIYVLGTLKRDVSLSGSDESLSAIGSRESGRKRKRDGE